MDDEFNTLIGQANGILDVEDRRKIMCDLETIMQERGPAAIAYWCNNWRITAPYVEGLEAHPSKYDHFDDVWINPEKQT